VTIRPQNGFNGPWADFRFTYAPVDLAYGDWFFLPEAVFEAPAFWSALWRLGRRLKACVFVISDTLSYARPKARSRALSSSGSAKHHQRLMIRYNLARTRDDVASLRALLQRYPTWKEPRDMVARLAQRGALGEVRSKPGRAPREPGHGTAS
jgi:hypothetical protein